MGRRGKLKAMKERREGLEKAMVGIKSRKGSLLGRIGKCSGCEDVLSPGSMDTRSVVFQE